MEELFKIADELESAQNTDADAQEDGEGTTLQLTHKLFVVVCGVCNKMMRCATTTPCGHSFCFDCLMAEFEAQIARRGHRHCPTCCRKLQAVAGRLRPSDALNYLIAALGMTSAPELEMAQIVRNLHRWETNPADVTRMERYIHTCIERLRAMRRAVEVNQAVRFKMGTYEEGWWTGRGAQHEADYLRVKATVELRPPQLLYDAIMAPNIPFQTMSPEELGKLQLLDIHAIAAESAVIIIGGRACDTMVIADTMKAWGFVYQTVIATVNYRNPKDAVKQVKPYNRHKSHFFHAGSIAPIHAIANPQKGVLVVTTHEFKHLDTEFYDQMNKLVANFTNRAELFNPMVTEGWDQVLPKYFSP
jgi:N6-adenosine-specific RNA methylase IME4